MPHQMISDLTIQQLSKGDQTAFDQVFENLYRALCFFSIQITKEEFAAEDIVINAFVKIWNRRKLFTHFNVLKSYMYTMVKNDSLNWLQAEKRRAKSHQISTLVGEMKEPAVWEFMVHAELINELLLAMEKLPPQRQKIFKMLYREGLSVRQVAETLKISQAAVKMHKKAGTVFLRKFIHLKSVLFFIVIDLIHKRI